MTVKKCFITQSAAPVLHEPKIMYFSGGGMRERENKHIGSDWIYYLLGLSIDKQIHCTGSLRNSDPYCYTRGGIDSNRDTYNE